MPSHFVPPVPANRAVYGRVEAKTSGIHSDLQPHVVLMRCTNLVLGFVRLCSSCVELHKGVLDSVAWMFSHTTYTECLEGAVREVR